MNSVNILVEAKNEYTSQLQKILTPRLYEGFKSIYEDIIKILSNELIENKSQGSSIIKTFQKSIKEIPQWNQDIINKEYQRILQMSNCDYFDNLIEAIFITNTKILTSVQINDDKSQNIKINIPQPTHFIHKCYIECSKEIYKNPYIFDISKGLSPKEKHANLRDSLTLIDNSINNAIRDLLPIRDILSQGLTKMINNAKEREEEAEDEEEADDNEEVEDEEGEDEADDNEEVEEAEDMIIIQDLKIEEPKEEKLIINENNPIIISNEEKVELQNDILNEVLDDLENNNIKEIVNEIEINPIILDNNKNDMKEIFLNKNSSTSSFKKINTIQMMNHDISVENNINVSDVKKDIKIINEHEQIGGAPGLLIPSKLPVPKKIITYTSSNQVNENMKNPFIKSIRNNKFIKNKFLGLDKNNSFYQKKYNENSANFHSVSDGLKETNTMLSEAETIEKKIIAPQLTNEDNISRISKNQIKLDDNEDSSIEVDEDEENIDI